MARSDIALYVFTYFAYMAGVTRQRGYAFFDRLEGARIKKDMTIPPGYRRVLKNGRP
jgi:hypothetical protein